MADNVAPTMAPWDALQNILARKQALKRQAMLDSLNQQNIQSEISARAENAAGMREQREALAAQRQELANQKKLGTFSPGPVEDQGSADWLHQNFPQLTRTTPGTQPLKPGDEGPSMPAQTEYLGTPDFQESQARNKAILTALQTPDFDKMPLSQQMGQLIAAGGTKDPTSLMEKVLTSKAAQGEDMVPFISVDRQGHPHAEGKFPKGSLIRQEPAPERETFQYTTDGNGNYVALPSHGGPPRPVNMPTPPAQPVSTPGTYMTDPSTGRSVSVPLSGVAEKQAAGWGFGPPEKPKYFKIGTEPKPTAAKAAAKPVDLVDQAAYNKFLALAKSPSQGSQAAAALELGNIVGRIPDEAVRKDVAYILHDDTLTPMAGPDLVKHGVIEGDPAHIAKVLDVLKRLRGN